ncbi:MAG: S1/P1 nuclease [Candidatus Rokubacteria bacterium]|nr:S1/P1 nuclease [Candidatus Rokubacteria bacterium]
MTHALALLLVALLAGEAQAWSDLGHQAIGRAAQALLDDATKTKIARAAGLASLPDGELARMGTWLDDIRRLERGLPHALDPEAAKEAGAFVRQFPDHPTWHYVNLPLGTAYPDGASPYTRPNDVVGTLVRCIAVLEGRAPAGGMTPPIALRVLVHLVGDLHQPLHVSTGYFDVRDMSAPRLLREPPLPRRSVSDLGGNRLSFGATNLHAVWDHALVISRGADDAKGLAAELLASGPSRLTAPGDPASWPRAWATEASRLAVTAYQPLRFGPAHLRPGAEEIERIEITSPTAEAYARNPALKLVARQQLARAAGRLAELLRAIRWP